MVADNQQGRPKEWFCHYIAGFVDGEGTFHVGIHKRKQLKLGWQVYCEFHVSQHRDKASVLDMIKEVFGCGYIKENHPGSNRDHTMVYVVRNQQDLIEKVVPFFRKYTIVSPKQIDFEKFANVVEMVGRKEHLSKEGLSKILDIAFSMYGKGKYRKIAKNSVKNSLVPSETIRQSSRVA